jgi:hypothetical protein
MCLVDIDVKPRIRNTFIEEVAARRNIARIMLQVATMGKDPKLIWRNKI